VVTIARLFGDALMHLCNTRLVSPAHVRNHSPEHTSKMQCTQKLWQNRSFRFLVLKFLAKMSPSNRLWPNVGFIKQKDTGQ
jgi:hypothetical protein